MAQKQPPFKECVTAHWTSGSAQKMNGDKSNTEVGDFPDLIGRVVGERSYRSEGYDVNRTGVIRSANVGMSSESPVRNRTAESPRFPSQRLSGTG